MSFSQANIYSYDDFLTKLIADKTTANDTTALASLPGLDGLGTTKNPVNNSANISVKTAEARALGLPDTTTLDSTISLNTSIMNLSRSGTQVATNYDLMSTTMHEIDEALGLGSNLDRVLNGSLTLTDRTQPEDLFRYGQNSNRTYVTTSTVKAYFSINGGTNWLARFNQNNPPNGVAGPGDYSDWYSSNDTTVVQVQDAFGRAGSQPDLNVELTALDVIGYDLVPEPGSMVLVLTGLVVLGFSRKCRIRV
jgi:hypothetical protein